MMKEDFCYLCPYIEYFPPFSFDPGDAQCPGEFDPDSIWCPRHKEWEEELREEEYDEIDEIDAQKL